MAPACGSAARAPLAFSAGRRPGCTTASLPSLCRSWVPAKRRATFSLAPRSSAPPLPFICTVEAKRLCRCAALSVTCTASSKRLERPLTLTRGSAGSGMRASAAAVAAAGVRMPQSSGRGMRAAAAAAAAADLVALPCGTGRQAGVPAGARGCGCDWKLKCGSCRGSGDEGAATPFAAAPLSPALLLDTASVLPLPNRSRCARGGSAVGAPKQKAGPAPPGG